jgi:hypothetical protein
MSSRQPSRVVLYDKDGVVIHDASTPERIAEVNAALHVDSKESSNDRPV